MFFLILSSAKIETTNLSTSDGFIIAAVRGNLVDE
jgi:hypothetical protein